MPKRSYEEDYDYYVDEEYEGNRKGPRRFKKDEEAQSKKKKWERESYYEHDSDYDERR